MARHFDTWEDVLIAVKGGFSLSDVPDKLKTPELCLAAVQQDDWALQYVPEALKTPELCLAAVQQDGRALGYVPDALKIEILKTLKPLAAQETN